MSTPPGTLEPPDLSYGDASRNTTTLVIGDMGRWLRLGRAPPSITGFVFIDFADLTGCTIARVSPRIVLSPLVVGQHDAVDIARKLVQCGFTGLYRVVTDGLPRPDLVIAEVAQAAPGLDFAVLNLPPPAPAP